MRWTRVAVAVGMLHLGVACGGDVVVTPDRRGDSGAGSGSGGAGGDSSSSSGASASSGTGTTGSFAQSSSSSGVVNPCDGMACGAPCTVCNDVECFMGACDASGFCEMPSTVCKTVGSMQPCPVAEQAPPLICADCGGGKGCTFFGCVLAGPSGGDGTCCYDVVGGCAPNP